MLPQKSLRHKFFFPLATTVSLLVVIFALMSYQILKINILHSQSSELIDEALLMLQDRERFKINERSEIVPLVPGGPLAQKLRQSLQEHAKSAASSDALSEHPAAVIDPLTSAQLKQISPQPPGGQMPLTGNFSSQPQSLSVLANLSAPSFLQQNYQHIYLQNGPKKPTFRLQKSGSLRILQLLYPLNNFGDYLLLKRDISVVMNVLDNIFLSVIFLIFLALALVLFYSLFISKLFSLHMRNLALKLSAVESDFGARLNPAGFPAEFSSICESINQLIERIFVYNSSQKELFIGIAHELKTPLAIIKARNDVALLRERDGEYYRSALKENNENVTHINKIITEILKIGRNEGATFEEFSQVCLIEQTLNFCKNFSLLGAKKHQRVVFDLQPNALRVKIQLTLFKQILQNFLQNALKFSPEGSQITVKSRLNDGLFRLEIIDCGCGINEQNDHFAPFKRFEKSDGIGLGLYLCRIAAAFLGAQVGIANRTDAPGALAWLEFRPKIQP